MKLSSVRVPLLLANVLVFCAAASPCAAKDHFLTIGGGYGPTGNQLSIERNVIFQQSVLSIRRPDKPSHDVYFADGDDEARDVQLRDPSFEKDCPAARRIIAEIFGDADDMDLVYRNNEVPNKTGPAERRLIRRRFRELARELKSGDRLIVYMTGHGSEADAASDDDYDYEFDEKSQSWRAKARTTGSKTEANEYDTSFYVWDEESISASEFTDWLDRLPTDVEVVLVMVQCYAGGFAHTIFYQADADLGVAPHARCGFFAQVHDRGAAGCTPDATEADYEEYSSYFWGALGGETRTGAEITTADYDGDGHVSFAEAHAYAIIESDTIDIPVRTTGAFLRRYSQLGKTRKNTGAGSEETPIGRFFGLLRDAPPQRGDQPLAELKGPLASLVPLARPDQRAVLEQLPPKLGLGERTTIEELRRKLTQVETKGSTAGIKFAAATQSQDNALERLQEQLREIWPELHAEYSPLLMALASERGEEFVAGVEGLAAYKAYRAAKKQAEQLSDEPLRLAREEARLQRLLRTCEDVVLAANLPHVAPTEIVARYERLVSLEEGTLTGAASPERPTQTALQTQIDTGDTQ